MAIKKEIELDNGVVVTYHRITSINKITNVQNIIEVSSYTTDDKREEEKEHEGNTPLNIFINTDYITKEYNENETIKNAYSYLKTLDKYKGAEDV